MTINWMLAGMVGVALLTSCGGGKKPEESAAEESKPVRVIPMRDFFRNPDVNSLLLSPDGDKIGFLKPYQNRMNLFVVSVGGTDTVRLTSLTDRDISNFTWKTNDRILYSKDKDGDENWHLFVASTDGKMTKELTPFPNVRVEMVDELENNNEEVLVQMNKRNPQFFDAYRLNINTGEAQLVAENPGGVQSWIADHSGTIRMASQSDGVTTVLLYRASEKDKFKPILTTSFKEQCNPLFFSFDNKFVYASSNIGRDKSAIVKIDPENGAKEIEKLYEDPEYDVSSLHYSNKRKVLTYISITKDKEVIHYLDKPTEDIFNKLKEKLGDKHEILVTSHNRNEDKFMVRTLSDRTLGTSYFYDAAKNELTKVIDRSPWLKEEEMAEMKPITYTSKDGLIIHGYLTLPVGVEPKNLPMVVNPHGGPWARDAWGFNQQVQFLANRGYAVLQMNFRGSTGYGRKFWESSFKQWGQTMQQDITDGVNYLVKEGIADPKRVGIYGGSYGGYATLAGLTLTPDVYACGVDFVGVSNMFTFMNTIPPYWKPYLDMFHEMVGDPVKDSVMMKAVSPVYQIDKIKAPLFVAQGANDPRVNQAESEQIVNALKKKNIPVEYLLKKDEGHGFHNEENRFEFYGAMEKFLAKHLGGRQEGV